MKLPGRKQGCLFAQAAAFGRLCVETAIAAMPLKACAKQPPSGGCVLKQEQRMTVKPPATSSRLRAAVC